MLLLTSAVGNQGKLLLPKMATRGVPIRACVRSERSAVEARKLGASEVIVGDLALPGLIERALDGVDNVYYVCPSAHPQEREIGCSMVDRAKSEGVEHFVYSSVLHPIVTDLIQHEIKRDVEERLISSGLEFTILQPSNYMLPAKMRPVFEEGVFKLSWSLERRQSLVHLGDITDVAVKVLTESEFHQRATYELVGRGRYTAHELSNIISLVLGRSIPAVEISADTYLADHFGEADRSQFEYLIRVLRGISTRYGTHDFVGNSNVLEWLLGRRATSFEDFVRAEYVAYLTGD